jgi:hypothetical protein
VEELRLIVVRLARKTSNLKMAHRILGQAALGSLAHEYEAVKCEYVTNPSTLTLHKLLNIAVVDTPTEACHVIQPYAIDS